MLLSLKRLVVSVQDELLKEAMGKVLEVGVGTGINLGRYRFASSGNGGKVESVVGIDLSRGMLDEVVLLDGLSIVCLRPCRGLARSPRRELSVARLSASILWRGQLYFRPATSH